MRAGRGRLHLLLQPSRPDQPFCAAPRAKNLLTPASACISSPAAGWRVPGLPGAVRRLSCPLHTMCFYLPDGWVQTCTSMPVHEFGTGELPVTPPCTECPAKVPVLRLNLY